MVLAPKIDKHKKKDRAGILLTCFFYIVISEENLFLLGKKVEKKKNAPTGTPSDYMSDALPIRLSGLL